MFFETFETEILARLNAKITNVEIEKELLPENQAQFTLPIKKARVSVTYKESDFDKSLSTAQINQPETMRAELYLTARAKRGAYGIYDLFNKCRLALIGYMPSNCNKLYAIKFEFWQQEKDLWVYRFEIAGSSRLVEEYDETEEEIGGNLTTVTFEPET